MRGRGFPRRGLANLLLPLSGLLLLAALVGDLLLEVLFLLFVSFLFLFNLCRAFFPWRGGRRLAGGVLCCRPGGSRGLCPREAWARPHLVLEAMTSQALIWATSDHNILCHHAYVHLYLDL